jgi:hypothetical protein
MSDDKKKGLKETTIIGFVEEIELEDGNPGLQISDGDHEYAVVMDRNGKKLLDFIDEEISATGTVKKTRGQREIQISQFRLMDDDYDDENDGGAFQDSDSDDDDDLFK